MTNARRTIPSVEKVLQELGATGLPRAVVVGAVRRCLDQLRQSSEVLDFDTTLGRVRAQLQTLARSRIQPVINGTGILIHTNLGRAPLSGAAVEQLARISGGYCNLEFDLNTGARGERAGYLERNLALLCGGEAATVVNNCAAALVLVLRQFCRPPRNEVILSRGELVQIGGGFRVPEILESSGARLREVGTTNRTVSQDYERALGPETALILKVHQSNFFMGGFVESVPTPRLAQLAEQHQVLLVEDLGSGAVVPTESLAAVEHEPTPAEVLRAGVHLICCSGDKLLGGPQAGIIAGRAALVSALKTNPFFRALRCDKLILAALQTTVDLYLNASGERPPACHVPVLEMLETAEAALRERGGRLLGGLQGLRVTAELGQTEAQLGGGTLPRSTIPSISLDLRPAEMGLDELSRRLRLGEPAIIGYVAKECFRLDLRTIFPEQDVVVLERLREALA